MYPSKKRIKIGRICVRDVLGTHSTEELRNMVPNMSVLYISNGIPILISHLIPNILIGIKILRNFFLWKHNYFEILPK